MTKGLIILGSLLAVALVGCGEKVNDVSQVNSETAGVRITIVGDSTVSDYPLDDSLRGWGQLLPEFLADNVTVLNHAMCGRSSKSFLAEGRWDAALATKADFYLIQFGHNDCPGKGERTTDPDGDYQENLARYIRDARAAGGKPVLVTSMERRNFNADGTVRLTLDRYAAAVRKVGAKYDVPVLDLNARSIALYEQLGDEGSAHLMCAEDRTHFVEAGAREMAALVAAEIREKAPELAVYLTERQVTE